MRPLLSLTALVGLTLATSVIGAQDTAETWWSLTPLQAPDVPPSTGWERNAIDAFVHARLREEGLSPSPEAERRTLLRRVPGVYAQLHRALHRFVETRRCHGLQLLDGLLQRIGAAVLNELP